MAKCLLCNSKMKNDAYFGELLQKDNISVHEFCLYLSSGLVQNGRTRDGIFGFLPKDIKLEQKRVQSLKCYICNKFSANIGCCESKCRKSFHLICGVNHGVENQFTGSFRSFCDRHVRRDRGQNKPTSLNELCCICYELLIVPGIRSHYTSRVQAPCCKNGWFHRNCLQSFARSAGYFLKCPLCNDASKFLSRMPFLGIFLRNSDASWEMEPNAFAELLQRPNKCEADSCLNKNGRNAVDDEENPLVYCLTCGSVATHKLCLPIGIQNFNCKECKEVIEQLPHSSTQESDSGHESIPVEEDDDENDEVEICYVSETDDDENVLSSFRKNTPCVEQHKSLQYDDDKKTEDKENDIKETAIRFNREGNNRCRSISNGDDSSGTSSQESSESAHFRKLNRKRKIPIEFDDESSDYDTQKRQNNYARATNNNHDDKDADEDGDGDVDADEDEDPLMFLSKMLQKKEKCRELMNRSGAAAISIQDRKTANETDKVEVKNHLDSVEVNTIQQTEIPISYYKVDTEIWSSEETDNRKNIALNNSCIANRTRRRSTVINKLSTEPQRTIFKKSPIICSSGASIYSSSDENKNEILNVSCIAKRTRQSVSNRYYGNKLRSIGEESDSESCSSHQTATSSSTVLSSSSSSSSASSSSSSSSLSSTSSSSSLSSLSSKFVGRTPGRPRVLKNKRLRIISSTDEEFDSNDALKNR